MPKEKKEKTEKRKNREKNAVQVGYINDELCMYYHISNTNKTNNPTKR